MDEVQFNSSEETLESHFEQLCLDIDIVRPLAITAGNTWRIVDGDPYLTQLIIWRHLDGTYGTLG